MLPRPSDPPANPIDWRRLRLWQIQPIRDLLLLAAAFGIVYLGYKLRIVTVPMLVAVMLAYLVEPMVQWMTHSGKVSRPGVAIGLIGAFVLVIGVPTVVGIGFAGVQGASLAQRVTDDAQRMFRAVDNPEFKESLPPGTWTRMYEYLDREERAWKAHEQWTSVKGSGADAGDEPHAPRAEYALVRSGVVWAKENAAKVSSGALQTTAGVFGFLIRSIGSVAGLLFAAFLTAFFFYFFSTGYGRLLRFWQKLIPEKKKWRVIELVQKMDLVIAGFVRGRLTVCAILLVFFTIGYWLIGVPAPLILGPVVGLLTLAPYAAGLGIPVAMLLMALAGNTGMTGEWWWIIGAPLVLHAISQVLDDYILTPIIQGKSTNMDTPTILFASIAGGVLGGIYGVLLAVPVAACIKILIQEILMPRLRAWAQGKAGDPLPISGGQG